MREMIVQRDGFPVLNQWLESSVPGLHFVGGLAGGTFGPICRFVAGARFSAQQVTQRAAELNEAAPRRRRIGPACSCSGATSKLWGWLAAWGGAGVTSRSSTTCPYAARSPAPY